MNQQVALIRGINVGRAKRVAMASLRALMIELGYSNVQTLLNSGNVVFTIPAAAKGDVTTRIQEGILARLGVSARVIVVSARRFAEIVADNPLEGIATNPARLLVVFPASHAGLTKLEPLTEQDWRPEALALGRYAGYLWCENGILEGKLWKSVDRLLGETATSRNWTTVLKLHRLIAAS